MFTVQYTTQEFIDYLGNLENGHSIYYKHTTELWRTTVEV